MTIEAILATWPAVELRAAGGFTLRRGAGGGNRTSAATLDGMSGDIPAAEAAMRAWEQRPVFMIRPGEAALDADLAARGYEAYDHTRVLAASAAPLAGADPERAFFGDMRLRVLEEVWAPGGIGPERVAVMARAPGPKIYLLGRHGDRVGGAGFAAIHGDAVVMHAVEVTPAARRTGIGAAMVRAAAAWGRERGAGRLLLAVTQANVGATALYRGLGFEEAAAYHYRRAPAA
ncbi:ribosomal protein S18 acetylase RimI-like enzyme [Amaricoccus macauensis]|uniref:Ribosomal protein S18 acetylase RimI-like enzyme n=1 Tax=Amaricoccus macauensis TaxID=57001 RepID=A0A840SPB2_9RHOB|nr:ribosomal protein S18 acetylase RimI-like enzyme [Amaricoccus macauensis]